MSALNGEPVFRAITNKNWRDKKTQAIKRNAFLFKGSRQEEGLSVYMGLVDSCMLALEAVKTDFRESYGAGHMNREDIPTAGGAGLHLRVEQDAPNHGQILGLPDYEDPQNEKLAEDIANALLEICTDCGQ